MAKLNFNDSRIGGEQPCNVQKRTLVVGAELNAISTLVQLVSVTHNPRRLQSVSVAAHSIRQAYGPVGCASQTDGR